MHVWRERLHRWFAPLAERCPLSPNAVSLLALVLNVIAAGLLYRRLFLPSIAFIAIGGLTDAFDGIVARVQGKTTRYGDFLDHFADRVSDLLLAVGWLLGSGVRGEIALGAMIAIMLNGYIGTQIEATWRERDYDSVGRGEFVLALVVFPIVSYILFRNAWDELTPKLGITEWMALQFVAFAVLGIVQRLALSCAWSACSDVDPPSSRHRRASPFAPERAKRRGASGRSPASVARSVRATRPTPCGKWPGPRSVACGRFPQIPAALGGGDRRVAPARPAVRRHEHLYDVSGCTSIATAPMRMPPARPFSRTKDVRRARRSTIRTPRSCLSLSCPRGSSARRRRSLAPGRAPSARASKEP
jgi:archaetidylinositol phosphate synthase